MHACLYYKPGILKQKLSRSEIKLMKDYCDKNKINLKECGKIVIAKNKSEAKNLDGFFEIGIKNKLKNLEKITSKEVLGVN